MSGFKTLACSSNPNSISTDTGIGNRIEDESKPTLTKV